MSITTIMLLLLTILSDSINVEYATITDNEKEVKWSMSDASRHSSWEYLELCERLHLPHRSKFVRLTQYGTVDCGVGTQVEIERLYNRCLEIGVKPSRRLRELAVGYRPTKPKSDVQEG